jgi:hypothetical protein
MTCLLFTLCQILKQQHGAFRDDRELLAFSAERQAQWRAKLHLHSQIQVQVLMMAERFCFKGKASAELSQPPLQSGPTPDRHSWLFFQSAQGEQHEDF